jgi:putative ATP-binding cassette transporter
VVLIGYTLALFQLMSPIEVLMGSMPALTQAAAATQAVRDLGFSLESEIREKRGGEISQGSWETLELVGVTHSYQAAAREGAPARLRGGARRENEEKSFQLGPIDLTFHPGELVFIVGGNGSGKTTLAKIILGLYLPESGEIRRNGQLITDDNREEYRQSFSAVFSDSFIFQTLFGLDSSALNSEARRYLEKLHLEQKVKVEEGGLSTIDLSQGQRKRLALLAAYMEDRPIYFFDEWAADQDPVFKKIFYYELLPELKSRGKTIFVISHDDHYFHVADRIVKLDYGQVEFDNKVTSLSPAGNSMTVLADGTATA